MAAQQPPRNRIRSSQETLHELVENLEVIRIALEAYRGDRKAAWRIVSARLHLLLTDRSRSNEPLALRVLPELRLHPLRRQANPGLGVEMLIDCPIEIRFNPDQATLHPFDMGGQPLAVDQWLKQTLYYEHEEIRIIDLITLPRHQAGGVHFDPRLDGTLLKIERMFSFVRPPGSLSFRDLLTAIGEYVVYLIENRLIEALANGYVDNGDAEKAREFFEFGLAKAREHDDVSGSCDQLLGLAWALESSDNSETALSFLVQALTEARASGIQKAVDRSVRAIVGSYNNLGSVEMLEGNDEEAVSLFRLGLSTALDISDVEHPEEIHRALLNEARILFNLAIVSHRAGDIVRAICMSWCALTIAAGVEPSEESVEVFARSVNVLRSMHLLDTGNYRILCEASGSFQSVVTAEYGTLREFENWTPSDVLDLLRGVEDDLSLLEETIDN